MAAMSWLHAQSGPITVLSREGRRTLPAVEVQGHQMVGLDDLASLFQLQVREDPAARAITATYKNQTIVLTPDQSLVSSSGRLVSLPAPVTRRSNRWLVPVEFISRALAPIYDVRLDFRPAARLLVIGDLRVPRVTAQYDDSPRVAARDVRDYAAGHRDGHTGAGTAARAHRRRRARRVASGAPATAVADGHSRHAIPPRFRWISVSASAPSAPRRRFRAALLRS